MKTVLSIKISNNYVISCQMIICCKRFVTLKYFKSNMGISCWLKGASSKMKIKITYDGTKNESRPTKRIKEKKDKVGQAHEILIGTDNEWQSSNVRKM